MHGDLGRERGRRVETAADGRQHRLARRDHDGGLGVAGQLAGPRVGRERGLGGPQITQLREGDEAPEQSPPLEHGVAGAPRLFDDLRRGAQPFPGRSRIPQRVQPAVQDVGDHDGAGAAPGQRLRFIDQSPSTRRGRRVAQQFAREAGQHTGPCRRRQRAPCRSLQQAKEPDIEIKERRPGRHRQREMSDQVGGASGEKLETGQLAGEPESGSRPTPRGQPHRVDGRVGQIRHQHGQFRFRQASQPRLLPEPDSVPRSHDQRRLTGAETGCEQSQERHGRGVGFVEVIDDQQPRTTPGDRRGRALEIPLTGVGRQAARSLSPEQPVPAQVAGIHARRGDPQHRHPASRGQISSGIGHRRLTRSGRPGDHEQSADSGSGPTEQSLDHGEFAAAADQIHIRSVRRTMPAARRCW